MNPPLPPQLQGNADKLRDVVAQLSARRDEKAMTLQAFMARFNIKVSSSKVRRWGGARREPSWRASASKSAPPSAPAGPCCRCFTYT